MFFVLAFLKSPPSLKMSTLFLRMWLLFVACLRFLSVVIGFYNYTIFQDKLFNLNPEFVSPLYGRTFAVWTSVTCCLCVITAFNLDDQPIFLATLLSFFAALLHFVTEVFVYKTMTFSNSLSPLIVSSISIVWMLVQWPSHKKME